MGKLNEEPSMKLIIDGLDKRLKALETSKRFASPYTATAPNNPINGEMWFDSVRHSLNLRDGNTTQSFKAIPYTVDVRYTTSVGGYGTAYNTTSYSYYFRFGELVIAIAYATFTGNGPASNYLIASLPLKTTWRTDNSVTAGYFMGGGGLLTTTDAVGLIANQQVLIPSYWGYRSGVNDYVTFTTHNSTNYVQSTILDGSALSFYAIYQTRDA